MPGVNVIVVGSEEVAGNTIGTQTNVAGEYSVRVPESLNTLRFSFIGYQTVDVEIDGRTEIDVTMEAVAIRGEERVVVGQGVPREGEGRGAVGGRRIRIVRGTADGRG